MDESVGQAGNNPRWMPRIIKPIEEVSNGKCFVPSRGRITRCSYALSWKVHDDVSHRTRAAAADGKTKPSRGTGVMSAPLQTELAREDLSAIQLRFLCFHFGTLPVSLAAAIPVI